jgi:hypothetical protein
MDDLTARLEALLGSLRSIAETSDKTQRASIAERFRAKLALLIAEYGDDAVSVALDAIPDAGSPDISIH